MTLKSVFQIQLLVLSLIAFTSCKDGGGVTVPPGTDTTPVVPVDPTVPGVPINSDGFNVKVKVTAEESYIIHKTGDFSVPCKVANDATLMADKDIECLVEAEELEGVFGGVKMVINMPSSACSYMAYRPYFYFGRDYGDGPTAITVQFDRDGRPAGSSVTGTGGGVNGQNVPYCDYNYTATSPANCCTGKYDLTTINNFGSIDPEKPETTTTQTGISWGGKPGNCVGGYGAEATRVGATAMPMTTIYNIPNGYSGAFEIPGSLLLGLGSIYYANYYSSVAPAAFKLASTYKGNPYYEWQCLDDAFEIKSRIRVRIREWNSMAQFLLGAAGDPDATGTEAGWGTSVNDFLDWDDIITGGDIFPGPNN